MDIRRTAFWRSIQGIFPEDDRHAGQTGTYSRSRLCSHAQFLDRLETSARRARRNRDYVLLILLQFAQNGERLGENTGGEPVELLICRVSSCIRSSDSLCDLGGARFALLLDDVREHSAVPMVIEKLNATLSGACKADSQGRRPSPNLGASLFPAGDMSVSHIWLHTEAALEQAIATGPGCYSISPMVTGRTAMQRFELSRDLYKAFRANEFEAVYQPIVDYTGKHVHACEVLLRWQHPVRGCLYPETFLPLLEESGLIVPVGEWLLNEACGMARKLLDDGRTGLRVCVNISSRQLADRGFLLAVLDALYDACLEPHVLQLEFSERVLAKDAELLQRILPELKNAGVKLAIDHFGAGEAALAELVRLPINLIKLDRSLVTRLADDAVSQAIASGTMALARATGMEVAAVGVERQLQAGILEKLGCCEVQGSYYSQPVPGGEISSLLHS
jgi:EAL domain-containing protein (putative c-di-GMP-specific phosphodiesterase class I)/GGDEF domain-containing protein